MSLFYFLFLKEDKLEELKQEKKKMEIGRLKYTFQNQAIPNLLLKQMKGFEARELTRNISDQESHLHIEVFSLFRDNQVFLQ